MSVPAKRRPSSSKRRRAAHFAIQATRTSSCPKCGKAILPHRVCPFCGSYKGKEYLKSKLDKKEQKKLKKQKAQAAEKQGK